MSWKSMLMATAVITADPELVDEASDLIVVTDHDARLVRMLIRDQLAAFRAGDGGRAWRASSAAIRSTFGTPDHLLALINNRYPALLKPKQISFGGWSITPDGLGIALELVDESFRRHHVLYLVIKEADGWKVNGAVTFDPETLAEAA